MSDMISRKELLRQADYMENEHTRDVIRGLATTLPSATCHGCVHKNTWDEECKQCIRLWSYLHDNYEEEHT